MQLNSKRRVHGADFKPQCLAEGQQPRRIGGCHRAGPWPGRQRSTRGAPEASPSRSPQPHVHEGTTTVHGACHYLRWAGRRTSPPGDQPRCGQSSGEAFRTRSPSSGHELNDFGGPRGVRKSQRPRCGPARVTHLGRLVDVCVRARGGELVRESVGAQVALADKPGEQSMEDYQRLPSGGR